MKLTKLYIHNYKSFYDTTIELDKLNIVVGENNSGKSNLIDVLEFIDIAMSKDIERAIDDKGGYDKIKNYSAVGEEKVVVRATFSDVSIGLVVEDKIKSNWQIPQYITFSFSFSSEYSILTWSIKINTKKNETIHYLLSSKKYLKKRKEEKIRSFVFSKAYTNEEKQIIKAMTISFVHTGRLISTYYFDAQKIRTLSNQNSKYSELLKDGSNLGKILYEIKEKDENKFEVISNSLITTVNEIDGIEVEKVLGSYAIGFKERSKESIPIHTVSDGTINFLATMTALNQWYDVSSLLVFEEPERHLHLKVMDYLFERFRTDDRQIIVTTHSSELLNYANLEEIVFIYRDSDGDTQSIRATDIPNLKGKMERLAYERPMSLDEMISCGMVGNFE